MSRRQVNVGATIMVGFTTAVSLAATADFCCNPSNEHYHLHGLGGCLDGAYEKSRFASFQ